MHKMHQHGLISLQMIKPVNCKIRLGAYLMSGEINSVFHNPRLKIVAHISSNIRTELTFYEWHFLSTYRLMVQKNFQNISVLNIFRIVKILVL